MVLQLGEYRGKRLLSRKTIEQATRPIFRFLKGHTARNQATSAWDSPCSDKLARPVLARPEPCAGAPSLMGSFSLTPEEMIGITLAQLFPGEAEWDEKFMQLVYAAVDD